MEFPLTGIILLVLAIWFFLFSPRLLYPATIISIPFGATAIVNFPIAGSSYGLGRSPQKSIIAFQLFSVLWILREALSRFPQWQRRGWFSTSRARLWLLGFLGAVALSQLVPLILNGTSMARSFEVFQGNFFVATVPLRFSLYNVTQFAYLAFGIMFTIFVSAENSHPARLFYTVQLYVRSCVFVAAWGLLQFACTITGSDYPAYIFNTGKNESAIGYLETISAAGFTWSRISSVAQEPSVLAYMLVGSLALLLVCFAFGARILPHGWNWFATVLLVSVLLVSTSSTAYFGLFAGLILVALVLRRAAKPHWKYCAAVPIAAVIGGVLLVQRVPLVETLTNYLLLNKYAGMNSGATRLASVEIAAQSFLRYPILGAGWPNVKSWDLVLWILANMGLVGLLAFAAFLLPVLRGLWRLNSEGSLSATMVLPVLTWALLSAEGGGFAYGTGFFWFVFGLAVAAVEAAKVETPLGASRGGALAGSVPIGLERTTFQ